MPVYEPGFIVINLKLKERKKVNILFYTYDKINRQTID